MVGSDQRHTEQFGAIHFHAMATTEEQNPPKRPKVSHEEEAVIDLEDSEDGNLEEDVELENQLRNVQADLDKVEASYTCIERCLSARQVVSCILTLSHS